MRFIFIILARVWTIDFDYTCGLRFDESDSKWIDGLPLRCGKSGGWNCVPSDAKCDGKNMGGVPRGALLSSNGRYPFVLKPTKIS